MQVSSVILFRVAFQSLHNSESTFVLGVLGYSAVFDRP